jgi:myxalamid-type polyketide synthase MxaB
LPNSWSTVGPAISCWSADHGVRTPAQQAALAQLAEAGAQVDVVQADIAQVEEVRRLLSRIPALRGIVHAAGVLDDGLLRTQNPERFAAVMQPKADAAWHLHTLTQGLELDFFVAFSSMASLVGNPGQSNYAAANGFLDGLMQARRRVGLPGLSIAWGRGPRWGWQHSLGSCRRAWHGFPQQGRLLFYHLLTRQTGARWAFCPSVRRAPRPPGLWGCAPNWRRSLPQSVCSG